jgi:hypothetical protein
MKITDPVSKRRDKGTERNVWERVERRITPKKGWDSNDSDPLPKALDF